MSDRFPAGWESRLERYVVYTPFVSEAKVAVEIWLDADPSRRNCLDEVSYYARRYVGLERELRSSGRIIP